MSEPSAWPDGRAPEVRETHGSVVLLTVDRAIKLKRPIDLGFLDYSTLEKRRVACEDEVRLNAPRAPGVYLGAWPIVRHGEGYRLGGDGVPVEWAVVMRRLPDEATLLYRVEHGLTDPPELDRVGRFVAGHHAAGRCGPEVSRWATLPEVRRNLLENFDQSEPEVGLTVAAVVHRRLRERTEAWLSTHAARIDRRATTHARETHGDLRLDHVYVLPQGLSLVDGIEFSERLRDEDPVADLGFLTMDLGVRGRDDLADVLFAGWLAGSGDADGAPLLAMYESYRSAVRAKVAGLLLRDPSHGEELRQSAIHRARRHWLYALGVGADPETRPALVGIGGLPGTGKTTLSLALGAAAGFEVIRSDVVRKESGAAPRYDEAGKDLVYAECLRRASAKVAEGGRVIVDASFGRARWRHSLLEAARGLGVPGAVLECRTARDTALARLAARTGDASDADADVHDRSARAWEPEPCALRVSTERDGVAEARATLARALSRGARFQAS